MYCRNCGKFIGTDAEICDECAKKEMLNNENAPVQLVKPNANRGYYQPSSSSQDGPVINLGKAIASSILATVGFIFIYAALFAVIVPGAAFVCMIIGLVPSILGLVFGVQSISNFKQTSYLGGGKRIPVLILGISSVVEAAISIFIATLILLIIAMI